MAAGRVRRHRIDPIGEVFLSVTNVFRTLHSADLFVMPNAWDLGSARLLESLGFPAIATTSSGHAASQGRLDQQISRAEMLGHAQALVSSVAIPVNVDSETCFPDEPGGISRTVELIAQTGAAGCSIEDFEPVAGILPIDDAAARVREAAHIAHRHGLVLTARAENHLYGYDDLDDTIERLTRFRAAGADVVYAPGLSDVGAIARVVAEVGGPVNVLMVPGLPSTGDLAAAGVRRVSTGGSLAWAAYGAMAAAGRELLSQGTASYLSATLSAEIRETAFGPRPPR